MTGEPSGQGLLHGLLRFVRALRHAGLPVSPVQARDLARALQWIDLGSRRQVFYAARALLVFRHQDLPLFEHLFEQFFRGPRIDLPGAASDTRSGPRRGAPAAPDLPRLSQQATAERERGTEAPDRRDTAGWRELLRFKDLSQMSDDELAAVHRLLRETPWRAGRLRSRRRVPGRAGDRLDARAVLRSAAKHGGLAPRLHFRRRKIKQRPFVLLADVSGSMERYSRLLLQLFFGITHRVRRVESFVFGTRLTRITRQLELREPDRAMAAAAREVVDWAGGTRIGECLRSFNRHWARRVLGRGAVVVVVSDGWERGDPALLAREMQRLSRRCHRLVWLNPLLGTPGYRPLVSGMAAALPLVDDFLPVHNLGSLEALARHLARLPERRPERRSIRQPDRPASAVHRAVPERSTR